MGYTWDIMVKARECFEMGRSSPVFCEGPNGEYKWMLTIQKPQRYHTKLFLSLRSCNKPEVEASCKITVKRGGIMGDISFFVDSKKFRCLENVGVGNWSDEHNIYAITCNITMNDNIAIQKELFPACAKKLEGLNHECSLDMSGNLKDLLESQKFCDVTVITAGREIGAHKAILAARSPVFMAMFSHEMKEQQENRVDIADSDEEVVMEMFRFIYTGITPNLNKMAEGLLPAANKYQLLKLKQLCAVVLCETIETENAVDRFILGDFYDLVELKALALDFICEHGKEVIKTNSYKSLSATHPHLLDEAFQALVTKTK